MSWWKVCKHIDAAGMPYGYWVEPDGHVYVAYEILKDRVPNASPPRGIVDYSLPFSQGWLRLLTEAGGEPSTSSPGPVTSAQAKTAFMLLLGTKEPTVMVEFGTRYESVPIEDVEKVLTGRVPLNRYRKMMQSRMGQYMRPLRTAMPLLDPGKYRGDYESIGHLKDENATRSELWIIHNNWQFESRAATAGDFGNSHATEFPVYKTEDYIAKGRFEMNDRYPQGIATLVISLKLQETANPRRLMNVVNRVTRMLENVYGAGVAVVPSEIGNVAAF